MRKVIPEHEINVDLTSYVDTNGRVFQWSGGIFRGIVPEKGPFYRELVERGVLRNLQQEKLVVQTEVTPFQLDGYGLVLKHSKIPFLTYCVEWPAPMLKKAAFLTLEINIRLVNCDLILQDAYPWNVYFEGTKPVFIDIGSIVPIDENIIWVAYHQFCRFFLYPLYLHSMSKSKVARHLLGDYWDGVTDDLFKRELSFSYVIRNPRILFRVILPYYVEKLISKASSVKKQKVLSLSKNLHEHCTTPSIRNTFLKSLYKQVSSIKIPRSKTNWTDYYQEKFPSFDHKANWSPKQKSVSLILERLKPKTVLDIGCNTGWYSIMAAKKGIKVCSFDKDESCISNLYYEAERENLYIIPLVMDFVNPTPSFGWCCKQFPSAIKRLKCEMVFALALVHHLVFVQWQNFDRIAEGLDAFTKKWLLVEWIPREDEYVQSLWQERFEWYTVDNLRKSLNKYCKSIEVFDSYPQGRKLLLCEKRFIK